MSATTDSRRSSTENILYISVINAFFWSLALIVSLTHLPGTACFERLLPVLVGGTFVAGVAVVVAWKQRGQ